MSVIASEQRSSLSAMADARLVVDPVDDQNAGQRNVFEGLKFFLVQRMPQRSNFVQMVQDNGGRVVKLDSQADHIVADHLRDGAPVGSISYTFIEVAVRDGQLPDPDGHRAGPIEATPRPVGSTAPPKGTRTPFTADDDRALWDWVEQQGSFVKGNEIYKQLEAHNPRHTWQSWRDRYVKRLINLPPPHAKVIAKSTVEGEPDFTTDDFENLLSGAHVIENLSDDVRQRAWDTFAAQSGRHCAHAWREFYVGSVRPAHMASLKQVAVDAEGSATTSAEPVATNQQNIHPVPHVSSAAPPTSQKRKRMTPEAGNEGNKKHRSLPWNDKQHSLSAENDDAHTGHSRVGMTDAASVSHSEDVGNHDHEKPRRRLDEQHDPLSPSGNDNTIELDEIEESREAIDESREELDSEQVLSAVELGNGVDRGNALSELNLARHQAQQRNASGRAADLSEDDDSVSQTQYIAQLQNLLPAQVGPTQVNSRKGQLPASSDRPVLASDGVDDTKEETLFVSDGSVDDQGNDEPFADDELDEIMHATLRGPVSPTTATTPTSDRNRRPAESPQARTPFGQTLRAAPDLLERSSQMSQQSAPVYPALPGLIFEPTQPLRDEPRSDDDAATSEAGEGDEQWGSDEDQIDLDVPEPEGGFHFDTSPPHPSVTRNALDTQDILNAETQWPDLTIAPPDVESGDEDEDNDRAEQDDHNYSEESTPQPLDKPLFPRNVERKQARGRRQAADVDDGSTDAFASALVEHGFADAAAFLTKKVKAGYAEAAVIEALERTSMLPDLADIVLLCDKVGDSFPDDIPGIWSIEEDAQLEGPDAMAIRRLHLKHGSENADMRMKFLQGNRDD